MRLLPAAVLILLLAPEASAQTGAAQPLRTVPTQPEIGAPASFETSYLLALYMTQLAIAGTPPSQADIDKATRQYLTNGAAVTGVPASGPGAAYFQNGAAVTGVPSSGPAAAYFQNGADVLAYKPPSGAPPPSATPEAGTSSVEESYAEDAGVQGTVPGAEQVTPVVVATAEPASPAALQPGASVATGPACATPDEIEAAMAIARQFQTGTLPPPTSPSTPPTASTPVPSCAKTSPPAATEPAPQCPPGPSLLPRIATALGGALLGGLAVVLWLQPRRAARRRAQSTQVAGRWRPRSH
jgi:hypothetical protein